MSARIRFWIWLGLVLLFSLCVFLKINGSSVGAWNEILNEPGKVRGLLFSTPKRVRADEWFVWTPAALSQARQSPAFPSENLSLGGGRAPLIMSLPVAHYTMLFRPQLWGFFIFDFERAFSFYWCCKIFALVIVSAWFLRQLGIRNNGIIVFGTLWVFFSGFVQWWFSSPAMLPEILATWMICTGCAIRFFRETTRWRIAAAFAAFAFCGVNFVLCLYPPFQIPLIFLAIAILIGICFELRIAGDPCFAKRGLLLIAAAVAVVVTLLVPFWIDIQATLQLVAHTDYPGSRRSTGGDLSIFKLFSGLAGFFATEKIFPKIYDNVCEASNFYPLWPAVFVAVVAARWRRLLPVPPLIVALAIFIISLSFYCLIPLPNWVSRGTLLGFVPERRALLALGLANIFLGAVFLDRYRERIFNTWGAIVIALLCWLVIVGLFWRETLHTPDFFPDRRQIALALIANGAIMFLFWQSRRWFAAAFTAILVLSNAGINPIMRGLSPLLEADAFRKIDNVRSSDPKAKWLVYHDFVLANLVIPTGAPVLNGTKTVPDFTFLNRIDPDGSGNPIYNRYAYIDCEIPDESHPAGAHLFQHDCYILYLPPEAPVLAELGCRFLLFPEVWPDAEARGFALIKEIMPAHIWIYQRR